ADPPPPAPRRVMSGISAQARRGFGLFQLVAGRHGLDLHQPEWLAASSGPEVALDYTALLTNPREEAVDVLLLPFLDLQLLPTDDAAYFRVQRISGAAVTLSLRASLAPAPHEFQVLAVASPYLPPGGPAPRVPQNTVTSAARVLIRVEP